MRVTPTDWSSATLVARASDHRRNSGQHQYEHGTNCEVHADQRDPLGGGDTMARQRR